MSRHQDHPIICPNCGKHAIDNYCSQCGQPTHLHQETVWGLIMHFIGHYFHYDSKFWQTMKALWFSPGKLTLAYWNKQRARYIPPVSLYIFISFIFFFLFLTIVPKYAIEASKTTNTEYSQSDSLGKSFGSLLGAGKIQKGKARNKVDANGKTKEQRVDDKLESYFHFLPKMFFFMIPLMALILKGLFFKHKGINFVDHTIFSLHLHSFFFSIFILLFIDPFTYSKDPVLSSIDDYIDYALLLTGLTYLIFAIRNAYKTSVSKAASYSFLMVFAYFIAYLLVFVAYAVTTFYIAKYHLGFS